MDRRRRLGQLGEALACRHLLAAGYELLERNYRTRYGELDVVARNERFLVFCEVKTRIARGACAALGPLVSVGARKRAQVRAVAREWLANRQAGGDRPPEIRFDAIGVLVDSGGRLLRLDHLEGAF